jgi:GT2 family glycosyltransferase
VIVCEHLTAVVILSYNSLEWHKLFLPKIVEQATSGYDVVVVDHASPDSTAEFIEANYPSVKLIRLQKNKGFSGGYADALAQISAKYYILLSADFEVTDNWYPPLERAMEAHPDLGAVQPKIRFWKDRKLFEYAGAAGGFMDKWGYMFCRGRLFDTLEEDKGQYDTDITVFWASGGCLMVRSDAFHQVGGLDPDLFAHMEEIDLCWRLQNRGYKIGAIASATVFHVGGSIISYGSPQKTFYNYRNNLAIIVKNERLSKMLWLVPWRLVLDGVSCARFITQGQFKNIWAVARAHFSFYASLGSWIRKRRFEQKEKKNTKIRGVYSRSIIWKYFAQKKNTFDQLDFETEILE